MCSGFAQLCCSLSAEIRCENEDCNSNLMENIVLVLANSEILLIK